MWRYVIISKWKNEAELDQHFKTAHVKEFGEALQTSFEFELNWIDHHVGEKMKGNSSIERLRRYTDIPNLQYYWTRFSVRLKMRLKIHILYEGVEGMCIVQRQGPFQIPFQPERYSARKTRIDIIEYHHYQLIWGQRRLPYLAVVHKTENNAKVWMRKTTLTRWSFSYWGNYSSTIKNSCSGHSETNLD